MNPMFVWGIVAASILGSLHCAGMCGAFVSLACGLTPEGPRRSSSLLAGYHGGRLVGYLVLGALAGAVGSVVDLGASAAGLGKIAAILGSVTMLVIAGATLASSFGISMRPRAAKPPLLLQRAFGAGVRAAQNTSPTTRSISIGVLTVLLPCGWLYAFAIFAASTASVWQGAVVMGAFWVGTVPVLSVLGLGVGALRSRLGGSLRTVSTAIIFALGLLTLGSVVAVDEDRFREVLTQTSSPAGSPAAGSIPSDADCPLCETGEHTR